MAITPLTFTPQTELDAVNQMLMSIGQAPVSNIVTGYIGDVNIARLTLHNCSREVQGRGWAFNVEEDYPLAKDVLGKVAVPTNALSVDPSDRTLDYVVRTDSTDSVRRLYSREDHTFILNKDVKVDIKWFLAFDDLPQAARAYISHYAGRVFQTTQVGSELLYKFTKEREIELHGELLREELQSADTNAFSADVETALIAWRDR